MTASLPGIAETPSFALDRRVAKAFLVFSSGWWRGPDALRSWLLTGGLALFLIGGVGAQAALNWCTRWFFDALERKDADTAALAVLMFIAIIASMAAIGVGIVLTRESLQVRWRAHVVRRLTDRWLDRQRFYHMGVLRIEPPNPEYRIADDSRWATEPLTDMAIGLLSASVAFATFIGILWSVGGSYTLASSGFTIPAYMVLVALAYGIIASSMMAWVGRPLVGYVGRKNEAEGHFRFALMRVRENAESVALMRGEDNEKAILGRTYDTVVARWLAIVRQHGRLTWITNSSGPAIQIVPLIFTAPKYLRGEFTLGQLMQIQAAFVQVQFAISWVVDNYNRIAEWYASAKRVMDVVEACDSVDAHLAALAGRGMQVAESADDRVRLSGVSVADQAGRPLIATGDLLLQPGERVEIIGDSSLGKSTLARVVAGLSPWRGGRVEVPRSMRLMVVPQKSYLPLGTLREALCYPDQSKDLGDARALEVLAHCGLASLAVRLDETARWDQLLSNGERQRLAIARLLLHRPGVVILDDALSALDEKSQRELHAVMARDLGEAAVISLAQRPSPGGFHGRQLRLERGDNGAVLRGAAVKELAAAAGSRQ